MIEENSSAYIANNSIYKNVKANIALGGMLSSNTTIIKNKIYQGTAEGIFLMHSGYPIIYYNKINENFEGIVIYEGKADIRFNDISGNTTNGITTIRNSSPKITHNVINFNEGVGIYVRDVSNPTL